ncbi:hypothetical protein MAV101_14285 [Mycobacterium avium subsp. hominissuis 101]|nr:hypothetical protein MAV101_14285 [Mycobacterium avium subsp. hominissuis 101]
MRTARYSTMRSLTSSRPWWSASRMSRAAFRSVESSVRTFHGSSSTVSSQVRIQPDSGLWSLARSSLPTSRSAASRTFSGRSAASTRARYSSDPSGSPSPSSLRIAASCWRSRNSFCVFSMPSRTSSAILSLTSTSARCELVQSISTRSRSATSTVSSSWRFCALVR